VKVLNTIPDTPILCKSDISIIFFVSEKYRISNYRYLYRKCPALLLSNNKVTCIYALPKKNFLQLHILLYLLPLILPLTLGFLRYPDTFLFNLTCLCHYQLGPVCCGRCRIRIHGTEQCTNTKPLNPNIFRLRATILSH
jgi:hypothetical protein